MALSMVAIGVRATHNELRLAPVNDFVRDVPVSILATGKEIYQYVGEAGEGADSSRGSEPPPAACGT